MWNISKRWRLRGGTALVVLFCLQMLSHGTIQAQSPTVPSTMPADLAMVPANALGFVHVRLADIWKNDSMKYYRDIFQKAGPKALAALDEQFVPAPSSIDRITVVALPFDFVHDQPRIVAIARFVQPFNPVTVRGAYLANARVKQVQGKEFYDDENSKVATYFPDNNTLIISDTKTMEEFLKEPANVKGQLSEALRQAATGLPMVAAVNVKALPLPAQVTEQVPPDFKPLLKTDSLIIGMDLKASTTLTARFTYANKEEATEAMAAMKKAASFARQAMNEPKRDAERTLYEKKPAQGYRPLDELPETLGSVMALGALATLDELLADLPVEQQDTALNATLNLPSWSTPYFGMTAVSMGLLLPAVQKVRESAAQAQASNNLKQIGLAMHNYHDTYGAMPAAAIVDKQGKKLLSWRVAILPFVEQHALYNQFKLDEPWDSEHNLKLAQIMPKVYADPRVPNVGNTTYYKAFAGKDAAFDWVKGHRMVDFADGTSNTVMVGAFGDPVIWTKPEDFDYSAEKPLPDFSKPFGNLLLLFGDGSVRAISPKTLKDAEKVLRAMITRAGGELFTIDQ